MPGSGLVASVSVPQMHLSSHPGVLKTGISSPTLPAPQTQAGLRKVRLCRGSLRCPSCIALSGKWHWAGLNLHLTDVETETGTDDGVLLSVDHANSGDSVL